MIETQVLNYLKSALVTNDVYLETPDTLPDEFVVFQIIDRSRENFIDAVTIRFWSYGNSKVSAANLDQALREAMFEIPDVIDNISASRLGGSGDVFDSALKMYRYQSYFNLTYMEV